MDKLYRIYTGISGCVSRRVVWGVHSKMRCLITICLMSVLSACATEPLNQTPCTEPRPQMCPMNYVPVCAILGDDQRKTYSNGCSACSDPAVVAYQPNACPQPGVEEGGVKTRF